MSDAFATDRIETARGSLKIRHYPSGLLVVVVSGHYGADLLPRYLKALADAVMQGKAVGFHDWEAMTGYDTECRKQMTEWTIKNARRIDSVHILVKHRIVAMGVATGSVMIGRNLVETYTQRPQFEAALNRHMSRQNVG